MASWDYTRIESVSGLDKVARAIEQSVTLPLDSETFGRKPWDGHIRLVQVKAAGHIYVIDLMKTDWSLGPVAEALKNTDAIIIGHNLKYDQGWFLFHYGIEFRRVFDTWRASALIHNGKEGMKHDLYAVADRELHEKPGTEHDLSQSNWSNPVLTEEQWDYAAWDVLHLDEMRVKLRGQLIKEKLTRVALAEFEAILPEACIEITGMPLDTSKWLALADKNKSEALRCRQELLAILPDPSGLALLPGFMPSWNLNSTQQMLKSLQMAGLPVTDTAESTLAMHAAQFPAVRKLFEYRGFATRVKTYGQNYLKHIDPWDKRIHASYYPMLATGRYSCSDPNLQNLPRTADFRGCFAATKGRVFVIADYSQIELRFVAQISGDRNLSTAFKHGVDVHTKTACLISGKRPEDILKKERQNAKPANFGFSFGMSWAKFVLYAMTDYGIAFTDKQAQDLRSGFFRGYPGIELWHKKAQAEAQKNRVVRTPGGRLRYLEERAFNEVYNTPVQGGAADGMKAALRKVYNRLRGKFGEIWRPESPVRLMHMVHDEILLDVVDDIDIKLSAQDELVAGMVEGMALFLTAVPVVAEPSIGTSWADK